MRFSVDSTNKANRVSYTNPSDSKAIYYLNPLSFYENKLIKSSIIFRKIFNSYLKIIRFCI
ncbi:hypothetical protein CCY99_06895 [Helicobacter sp. 16-1353]|nr:hypothetical protein CCY99_06895 [Helicobacter sp. 16-1353]